MFKTPLIFIQIHDVIILSFQRYILKPNVADILVTSPPIYSVTTSAEIKLIANYKIMSIRAHTVRESVC